MAKQLTVTKFELQPTNNVLLLTAKRSASGPETHVALPLPFLVAMAPHARRAIAAQAAKKMHEKDADGFLAVHPLPIQRASVHQTTDPSIGACLLVLDPGTDVELQLAVPTVEFARSLAAELLRAADHADQTQPRAN